MYTRGELFRWSYYCLLEIVSEFMEWDSLVYCRVKHGRNLFVQAYLMEFAIIHGTRKSSFLTFSPTTKWCWTHRFGDWVICDFKIQNILKVIEKGFYSVQKDVMSSKNIVDNDLICAEWWTFPRVCVCGEGFHLEISAAPVESAITQIWARQALALHETVFQLSSWQGDYTNPLHQVTATISLLFKFRPTELSLGCTVKW